MSGHIIEDPHRQRWIVISVAFASFMAAVDTYIVNVALPTIAHYFNVGTSDVALVTLAYLLVITSTLPIFGKVGDRTGFKKVFILGFAFFASGSFLCGLAPQIYLLVGARCIQGVGAAMLYAVGMAMIPRYIPEKSRGWAFGITATTAGLGVVIGAPLGGLITQYFSWHWIFLINVPVGIAAIFVALKVIPKDTPAISSGGKGFDVAGAIMSFLGLSFLVSALNKGQQLGWHHWGIVSMFIVSAILLVSFILWERRCKDPLLNLNLFKIPTFTFGAFAALFAWSMFAGGNFLLPFYLTLISGLQSSVMGALFLISSIIYIIMSPLMGRLSDRVGARILCSLGMTGTTFALLLFAFTLTMPTLMPVIIYLVLIGVSMGAFVPPNNSLTLNSIPQEILGAGSAASRAFQNLGMVLGVAIYETVFSAALPSSMLGSSLSAAAIPHDLLNEGFRNAFIAGAIMCAIGLILSMLAKEAKKSGLKQVVREFVA
ncbi:MAG: MFS transporter [Dehalococcoidia bacterium]|nr:MFS transporter [Dehalococcoidia bacterium]